MALLLSGIAVVGIHINEISEVLLIVFVLLLFIVIARITWHRLNIKAIPESSVDMLTGGVVGVVLWAVSFRAIRFNAEVFFLLLIPPIIYEAGYSLDKRTFFANIGLILAFALLGTFISTMVTGLFVWGLSEAGWLVIPVPLAVALAFGSLISAVDPVAVLSIFEETHVNEQLNMLVFGESVLNDAISIVLYNLFVGLSLVEEALPLWEVIVLAVGKFIYVSLGGVAMGLIWGLIASFITKYTRKIYIIEVLVAVICALSSYLLAEVFLMSGIVAILVAGMVESQYLSLNLATKSHVSLKYLLKLASVTADTIIFLELGISTVFHIAGEPELDEHVVIWDPVLLATIIPVIFIIRFVNVYGITAIANKERINKVSKQNQFILAYGGLRGAIAFALAFILEEADVEARDTLLTATLLTVWFTVFVIGITIKPLLMRLHVKLRDESQKGIAHLVFPKAFSHVREATTLIAGGTPGFCGILHIGRSINKCLGSIFVKGLYKEERELIEGIQQARKHDIETALKAGNEARPSPMEFPNIIQHGSTVRLQRVLTDNVGNETYNFAQNDDSDTSTTE